MTALAGCAWTGVSNNTSWLTVTSGRKWQRRRDGRLQRVSEPEHEPSAPARSPIGGQTFSVTQAAAACSYATGAGESVGGWPAVEPGRRSVTALDRVRVDGRQQQHALADGDERGKRHR